LPGLSPEIIRRARPYLKPGRGPSSGGEPDAEIALRPARAIEASGITHVKYTMVT
jgi:hypothetical protein